MRSENAVRRLTIESTLPTADLLASLRITVDAWTNDAIPSRLRATRITGATLRVRGRTFTLRLKRTRRVLAPPVCLGTIGEHSSGSVLAATIRSSRRWMFAPAAGTLLLAVAWMLTSPPLATTVSYALVVGFLWALNIGLTAVPVGFDPAAEQEAYVELLRRASGSAAGA